MFKLHAREGVKEVNPVIELEFPFLFSLLLCGSNTSMMAESRNLDQPLCQGWLQYRQSEHSKRFEKRWFVLKRRILWHYRSQDESPADAEYILYIGFLINFEVPNTIVLRKEQATFYLKAESEVEYQKWSNALLETDDESSTEDEMTDEKVELKRTNRMFYI
ncbi:hypothetical protein KUTeg_008816 [Tegillarca granosa]|uniref:PH domain-containing protein n=1 Tax=Tegillarca granosa TaxID=220873 RepID=A0ABQ9FA93_TEGGR|nr:hypothetical protein KUTeg_008816 [Tegillarca granosa]